MTNRYQNAIATRPVLGSILRSLGRASFISRSKDRDARRLAEACRALLSERGEVSGVLLANDAVATYRSLDAPARNAFFDTLATDFLPAPTYVVQAADNYRRSPSPSTLSLLQAAVESPRQELFRRLNLAQDGTGVLIEMRRHLLRALPEHPSWSEIDRDLAHLFRSWFNGGFLTLNRIDWTTSAAVLERLIEHEAVHQIQGWTDLRRRLEGDRRCYAFFHPALAKEPLIFIEIALTRGMSASVQPLLDPQSEVSRSADATCAIFYSITNCQEGLRGVSFGSLLIKRVVEDLKQELPRLKTFATLSPVPGFRDWLASTMQSMPTHPLRDAITACIAHAGSSGSPPAPPIGKLLRVELTRLCAYYLIHAKRGRLPQDSVARFHLANGARLKRLNWMGDTSGSGMSRSLGFMANYTYDMAELERNHEQYAREGKVVASHELQRHAKCSIVATNAESANLEELPVSSTLTIARR